MAQDFDSNAYTPGPADGSLIPPAKKNNKVWIIVIVVVVLLCCCCLVVGGGLVYRNFDSWMYQLQDYFNTMVIGLPVF